ncbi:hypothetical protein HYALB_00006784 [Hymenoscyphus albidus]|uniref:Uncharacterized protein n=1 Tax=Hymenoscyphus albidus TaxID=595503 RepID=A0A9N9Q2X8_9HELO|nr:hypothetical protein HYALB_00006784 [Hymenoscyphus albidus]
MSFVPVQSQGGLAYLALALPRTLLRYTTREIGILDGDKQFGVLSCLAFFFSYCSVRVARAACADYERESGR